MDKYLVTFIFPGVLKKYPDGKLDIFIHDIPKINAKLLDERGVISILFEKQYLDITIH